MKLNVNGSVRELDAEPDMPLLWALREQLGLTGTKYGCGVAQCGACTVHLNGQPARSCSIPVSAVGQGKVITIEGLSKNATNAVQKAWVELDVPQCGYCQSGQIMSAAALLALPEHPFDPALRAGDVELLGQIEGQSGTLGELCRIDTGVVSHGALGGKGRLLGEIAGGDEPYDTVGLEAVTTTPLRVTVIVPGMYVNE
jgi:isoquinoline 1-oxidoreductase alpha subunit